MSDFCPRNHRTEPGEWYLTKDDVRIEADDSKQFSPDWTLEYGHLIKRPFCQEAIYCIIHNIMCRGGRMNSLREDYILIEHIGKVCQCGAYPIELAMHYRLGLVPLLLENGADRSKVKFTSADLRFAGSNQDLLRLMLEDETIDVNAKNGSWGYPIQHAGNLKCLRMLVERGADINPKISIKDRPSILGNCLEYIRVDMVAYLIKNGVDMETEELTKYVARTKLHVFQLLIDGGYQFKNKCLLHRLVLRYDDDKIRYVLDHGLDIDERNAIGATALHNLAWSGNHSKQTDMIRLLLGYGADINAQDNEGKTPLHYVCTPVPRKHNVRTCSIRNILEAGANSRIVDRHGCTAFSYLPDKLKAKFVGNVTKRA